MKRETAVNFFAQNFAAWGLTAVKRIRARTKRFGVLLSSIEWRKDDKVG